MTPADLAASLNANLIANTQLAGQRLNVTGENLTGGLGVIQNTSIQHTIMAATAATLQADDAQAAWACAPLCMFLGQTSSLTA